MDGAGHHHIHKRKRVSKKIPEYPHSDPRIRLLDKIVTYIAIIGPLMTIPQILKIYLEKTAAGVSLLSWGVYLVFNIPWLIYGVVHKEKPIIISYAIWTVMNLLVVIGTIMYG